MFLKNKLFITLFLFFILIFSFSLNSFASLNVSIGDELYSFPDLPDYMGDSTEYNFNSYLIVKGEGFNSNILYELYIYDSNSVLANHDGYTLHACKNNSTIYLFRLVDDSWKFWGVTSYYNFSTQYTSYSYYTSSDILDEFGEVVFQSAPHLVEQVTIPEIQQVGEIPQAIAEVLKILIPIGLIVLSIGLVIYLTRLVISRVQ